MASVKKLKTFEGVYTPTVLTVLGVILYLRLGWVVGSVGLGGALIIIVLAHIITIATTLSMSSMLTNFKIGRGGAYAIISRSLGLEMGGAIGIPLYITQALGTAFYISGFCEVWRMFFPGHNTYAVGILTWAAASLLAFTSARLAFRIQYVVLLAILLSLVSFAFGSSINPGNVVSLEVIENQNFWTVFAIFFPAATGILTGATMSGDLENPRKSIISGTLAAVFTGLVVYIFVAYWFAHQVPLKVLLEDTEIIFKISAFKPLIIAGVMGAVLSSALSSIVSAPRTLSALAENQAVPFSKKFSYVNKKGEPVYATAFTSLISLAAILAGDLNSLAELLTLFFLTTYGMINLVVFLEQITGAASFRPSIKLPIIVPIVGAIGSFAVMVLINFIFTIVAVATISVIYLFLVKKHFSSPWGDIRKGVFVAIAEWAVQKSAHFPSHPRLWKPAVVIPVEIPEDFRRVSRFVRSLLSPSGRLYYVTVQADLNAEKDQVFEDSISSALQIIEEEHIFIQRTIVSSQYFEEVFPSVLQCLKSSALPPNMILFTISEDPDKRIALRKMMAKLRRFNLSIGGLWVHPKYGLGAERDINIWLRGEGKNDDLIILCALQLSKKFNGKITICRVVEHEELVKTTRKEALEFVENARLPANTIVEVKVGDFQEAVFLTKTDLNILGMPLRYSTFLNLVENAQNSLLFISSTGEEDALT